MLKEELQEAHLDKFRQATWEQSPPKTVVSPEICASAGLCFKLKGSLWLKIRAWQSE